MKTGSMLTDDKKQVQPSTRQGIEGERKQRHRARRCKSHKEKCNSNKHDEKKSDYRRCKSWKATTAGQDDEPVVAAPQPSLSERRLSCHQRCSTGTWAGELLPFRGSSSQLNDSATPNFDESIQITFDHTEDGFSASHMSSTCQSSKTGQTSLSSFLSTESAQLEEGDESLSVICLPNDDSVKDNNKVVVDDHGLYGSYSVFQLVLADDYTLNHENRRRLMMQPMNKSRRHVTSALQQQSGSGRRLSVTKQKNEDAPAVAPHQQKLTRSTSHRQVLRADPQRAAASGEDRTRSSSKGRMPRRHTSISSETLAFSKKSNLQAQRQQLRDHERLTAWESMLASHVSKAVANAVSSEALLDFSQVNFDPDVDEDEDATNRNAPNEKPSTSTSRRSSRQNREEQREDTRPRRRASCRSRRRQSVI